MDKEKSALSSRRTSKSTPSIFWDGMALGMATPKEGKKMGNAWRASYTGHGSRRNTESLSFQLTNSRSPASPAPGHSQDQEVGVDRPSRSGGKSPSEVVLELASGTSNRGLLNKNRIWPGSVSASQHTPRPKSRASIRHDITRRSETCPIEASQKGSRPRSRLGNILGRLTTPGANARKRPSDSEGSSGSMDTTSCSAPIRRLGRAIAGAAMMQQGRPRASGSDATTLARRLPVVRDPYDKEPGAEHDDSAENRRSRPLSYIPGAREELSLSTDERGRRRTRDDLVEEDDGIDNATIVPSDSVSNVGQGRR